MSKLPRFVSEQEEAKFWASHDSTAYLDDTEPVAVTFVDARPPREQVALRLDTDALEALKTVARHQGIGYQALIRTWVMERLAQEHTVGP